jgi:hypothetical protein
VDTSEKVVPECVCIYILCVCVCTVPVCVCIYMLIDVHVHVYRICTYIPMCSYVHTYIHTLHV